MEYKKEKPSRTKDTEQKYLRRVKNKAREFRKENLVPNKESIDYRQFVGWLMQKKHKWSRHTWRQYKSATVAYLETVSDPIAKEAKEALLEIESNGCVKKTAQTSGSKLKKFPLKDFHKLVTHLEVASNKWAIPLKRWIMVGLLTGVRPTEWGSSKIKTVEGESALIVQNAKNTNDRAHGKERTILLGMLDENEINMIQ